MKRFRGIGVVFFGLIALAGFAIPSGAAETPVGTVRIALVSDTHETRNPAKVAYGQHFDRVIDSVNAEGVDVVLIAGDLTDGGLSEQFDDFKSQVGRFKPPVRYVPGNHDIGDKHLESKPGAGVNEKRIALFERKLGPTYWADTVAGVRVIGVNTPLLGSGLPQEMAQWQLLERELGAEGAKSGLPVVLVEHYPLFEKTPDETGGGYWNIEPAPRQRFLDLLDTAKANVRVFLSAHLHRPLDRTRNNLRFIGTPPVSFGLPTGKQPEGWTLVTIPPTGPITSRFIAVADFVDSSPTTTVSPSQEKKP